MGFTGATMENTVKPFVTWVGGKTRLLPQLRQLYPKDFNRYFEPFLGGGAVFFDLKPKEAFLNDINPTLIAAYDDIKNRPQLLIPRLNTLQNEYQSKTEEQQSEFYYQIRHNYNTLHPGFLYRTVYLIFLSKTSFNGLYRENSKGVFNVSFGKPTNPTIFNEENLLAVAKALENATLTSASFEKAITEADYGDFVYFDPPYYPINSTANFTRYYEKNFLEAEQIQLRDAFVELDQRGCYVMLSNSNTDFISQLYDKFNKHDVIIERSISCKAKSRGKIKEYVITNY